MTGWKTRLQREKLEVEYGVVLGRLHESFLKVIEEVDPLLLVIGYKSHVFRPSSSERLIKSLKVPMLVVRGKAAAGATIGSAGVKRILCPVDFSENSKKAVAAATEYASLFSASLQFVHVIPSHRIKEKRLLWRQLREGDRDKFDTAVRAEAKAKLASFCGKTADEEGEVCEGHPGEVIPSHAEEGRYDLIVMGARGLSYVESVLIGSTTDAVLKSSPCPVLIVH
jgi:nucleotide-binding universal stress UspA family protein